MQAFREAEEASERRLEEEEEEEESPPAPLGSIAGNLNALGVAKKRRRGSISISRVGNGMRISFFSCPTVWVFSGSFVQHPELAALQSEVPTPGNASPVPWAPSHAISHSGEFASSMCAFQKNLIDVGKNAER